MQFIRRRVKGAGQQGQSHQRPLPGAGISGNRLAPSAPEEQGQDGILRDVGGLAHRKNNFRDRRVGQGGKQPMDERAEKPGCVLAGQLVAGSKKMTAIQARTGSQNLRNDAVLDTAG